MELLVPPSVSRAKFEREVSLVREQRQHFEKRGIWLVDASFPKAFLVFATPHLDPTAVLFGVLIDFSNYDLWPPSVRIVNPFTREIYSWKELKPPQKLPRQLNGEVQTLVQGLLPDDIPFLCFAGIREYHTNPGHTGDSWLLYRGDEGRGLLFILEQLHKYGTRTATYQLQVGFQLSIGNLSE